MFKRRLLKLADYMEKVSGDRYRQDMWQSGDLDDRNAELGRKLPHLDTRRVTIKEGACGTTACVFGHAVAAVPEAKLFWAAESWAIDLNDDGTFTVDDLDVAIYDKGKVLTDFSAAMVAFDIPHEHASVMFGGDTGPRSATARFYGEFTPAAVATALRNYVATNGASADQAISAAS